jgi:hypothetical protein
MAAQYLATPCAGVPFSSFLEPNGTAGPFMNLQSTRSSDLRPADTTVTTGG